MQQRHSLIAREGWPHLAIVGGLAILVTVFSPAWSWLFWLAFAFVLQFFRDPPRTVPTQSGAVVSAADGRVLLVEKAKDPYLERDALKISVFMNVFNVHSNRSPVGGRVQRAWYHAGGYLNAALDKASAENERQALWIKNEQGLDVTCVQIAGLIARRIFCYTKEGDTLARGQRYGFIRFGSRVDLYVPPNAQPQVSVGDRVTAGETVVAMLSA